LAWLGFGIEDSARAYIRPFDLLLRLSLAFIFAALGLIFEHVAPSRRS
jgi:hypothetical protein